MIALAVALAVVGLGMTGAAVYVTWHLGRALNPLLDRWLVVQETKAKPPGSFRDPMPSDILSWINRLPRKESREAQEAYIWELHAKLGGDWVKVREVSRAGLEETDE